jgi:hypothetical protein
MVDTKKYFNVWYKSQTESFLDINKNSNIRPAWLEYSYILNGEYGNSIIKPINHYVEKLYVKPDLISINNNKVVLQQTNHAEIFLLKMSFENKLKALDRPHMRQFYMSNKNKIIEGNKFNAMYRFYIPWFLDIDNVLINVKQPDNSPFIIEEKQYLTKKYNKDNNYVDPEMIFFNFLSYGPHMIDEEYGRIKRLSPMFNLEFEVDDIIINKIKEFYGKN